MSHRSLLAAIFFLAAGRLCAQTAMQSLISAEARGAKAVDSLARGDLAGAASLGETSFDRLSQIKSGDAVSAGYGGNGPVAPLTVSASRTRAAAGGGSISMSQEPPAPKGWEGFKNGFSNGFDWVQTPSREILDGSIECGDIVCVPSPSAVWRGPASLLVGVMLAVPAAIVGLFTGLFGALAGANRSDS